MERGRILHCDDSEPIRTVVKEMLDGSGHEIVAEAVTVEDAFRRLEEISRGGLDANIILLDGNLGREERDCDARIIVEKARELGITCAIVGLSLDGLRIQGLKVGKDIAADLGKVSGMRNLVKIIDALPEQPLRV